jgi:DNA-binding NarL/FixJ family response regulator
MRIAIADDHAIVRAGLRALLACEDDMDLLGEASDGEAALALATSTAPDVLLLDLGMPRMDGVEVLRRLAVDAPSTRAVVLSMHAGPEHVRPALRAGAHGYVIKGAGLGDLVSAIRVVHGGGRFLDAAAARAARGEADEDDDLGGLTPREREVLRLVALGHTNKSIGAELGVSPKTVDAHRTNLMRKLGIHDVQGLTRLAMRRGFVLDGAAAG